MLAFRWVSAGVLALLGLGCSDRDVTVQQNGAGDDPTAPLSLAYRVYLAMAGLLRMR